jgi:hypothetical protein
VTATAVAARASIFCNHSCNRHFTVAITQNDFPLPKKIDRDTVTS